MHRAWSRLDSIHPNAPSHRARGRTGTGTGFGGQPGQGGSGTCDAACAHYLECKGVDNTQNRAQCNQQCGALGLTSDQLANFEAADCASAVAAIDGPPGGSSGQTGTGGTSGTGGGTDCNGCTWDGSSCIYLTGSGGNYFACDRSCCP